MNVAVPVVTDRFEPCLEAISHSRVCRMLRPDEVRARTRFSSTHIHRLQQHLRFPLYELIGARARGLPEHVLDAFLAERMAARAGLPALGFRPPLPMWRFDVSKVPAHCAIRLLHRAEVLALAGFSKSTLHRLVSLGLFPSALSLGPRASRWVAHEIDAWVVAPASHSIAIDAAQLSSGVRS